MTVAHTSISAYHDTDRSCIRAAIVGLLSQNPAMTRRQISQVLGLETSCVAGRVNELINACALVELPMTSPCPITGKRVKWVAVARLER